MELGGFEPPTSWVRCVLRRLGHGGGICSTPLNHAVLGLVRVSRAAWFNESDPGRLGVYWALEPDDIPRIELRYLHEGSLE